MKYFCHYLLFVLTLTAFTFSACAQPENWREEWPRTDFSRSNIDYSEVISAGPPKDGIPAIDEPLFRAAKDITNIGAREPVVALKINGVIKAYPLRILMWHEITNDKIGSVPVTVTYYPLSNTAIVFDRRLNSRVLDFGVSGKLRHSNMIMYDRQTQSWWQQFTGGAIAGTLAGETLERLPARVVPFAAFKAAYPDSKVLVEAKEENRRLYGENPYINYDTENDPFLYRGTYDGPGQALDYVVRIDDQAWFLENLQKQGTIEYNALRLHWRKGMNSALDNERIEKSRDIGFIKAERKEPGSRYKEVAYDVTFAFAFKAFYPDGKIHKN